MTALINLAMLGIHTNLLFLNTPGISTMLLAMQRPYPLVLSLGLDGFTHATTSGDRVEFCLLGGWVDRKIKYFQLRTPKFTDTDIPFLV